jgi:hypothetical protein
MNQTENPLIHGFDYPVGIPTLFMVDDVVINLHTFVTACQPKLLFNTVSQNVSSFVEAYYGKDEIHGPHQDVDVSWEVRFSTHLFNSDLLAYGDLEEIRSGDYRSRRPHEGKCFYPRDRSCWKCEEEWPPSDEGPSPG